MPEGPEVETVRRSLVALLVGKVLTAPRVSAKKLRTPITTRTLKPLAGARVTGLDRRGKLLVVDVDGDRGLFVRLGMTGRFVVEHKKTKPALHTHVRFDVVDDHGAAGHELRFIDPRRFGEVVPFFSRAERSEELSRLGPDGIVVDDAGRAAIAHGLQGTTRSLKDALLDQTIVAGVGNIYAAEALFLARLSPFRAGADLDDDEAVRLVRAVEDTLAQGVKNRGTSFSDYVDGEGQRGDNQHALHVFQREGEACRACGTTITRVVQGARSTFFCPLCQG